MSTTLHETRRPKVGDHAWHVEFSVREPSVIGAAIISGDHRTELFWTLHEAVIRAEEVKTLVVSGESEVTPVKFEPYEELDARKYPHAGYWKPCGEKILFET